LIVKRFLDNFSSIFLNVYNVRFLLSFRTPPAAQQADQISQSQKRKPPPTR